MSVWGYCSVNFTNWVTMCTHTYIRPLKSYATFKCSNANKMLHQYVVNKLHHHMNNIAYHMKTPENTPKNTYIHHLQIRFVTAILRNCGT